MFHCRSLTQRLLCWIKAAPIREIQEERDRKDFDLILSVYKKRGYKKGAQSIYMGLLHLDPPVEMNIKKIRRLMCKYNLVCPIRKAYNGLAI